MPTDYENLILEWLNSPAKLMQKEPFKRGGRIGNVTVNKTCNIGETREAQLPDFKYDVVTQEQFMRELDPNCHDVMFDDSLPTICVRLKDGLYEVKQQITPVAFQKRIMAKKLLHLTGNRMQFTLNGDEPTEQQKENYAMFLRAWRNRNQDGMKTHMVEKQLCFGDAGLLFYFDYKGRIKSRILSFDDGYVICTHKDDNGDHILESVYYKKNDVEYIDTYDDENVYRYTRDGNPIDENTLQEGEKYVDGWKWHKPEKHGFEENPLITKRGDVAWNNVQSQCDGYETLYNIFRAIQKRFGWGILYVKGKFKDQGKKIAGNVVLNDTSLDNKGDAKFLTPPNPENMIKTLELMEDNIQKDASCTFILPKDISMSGDITGIAIELTQSMDIEEAERGVIEWQNVAQKMCRLFLYGYAKELVNKGESETAITDFQSLDITAKFKVWRPMNQTEYNNMLIALKSAGILSKQTAVENNTESKPDEMRRLSKDEEAKLEEEIRLGKAVKVGGQDGNE